MANFSNEKREQQIMVLRRNFNKKKWVTVESVVHGTGYRQATVIKWAKDGNIPLLKKDGTSVVPLTTDNRPDWLPQD